MTMKSHSGKIIREILAIERQPLGKGHVLVLTLNYGHKISRLSGLHLEVGKRVGCPLCPNPAVNPR
jgi:hypothetical protein